MTTISSFIIFVHFSLVEEQIRNAAGEVQNRELEVRNQLITEHEIKAKEYEAIIEQLKQVSEVESQYHYYHEETKIELVEVLQFASSRIIFLL